MLCGCCPTERPICEHTELGLYVAPVAWVSILRGKILWILCGPGAGRKGTVLRPLPLFGRSGGGTRLQLGLAWESIELLGESRVLACDGGPSEGFSMAMGWTAVALICVIYWLLRLLFISDGLAVGIGCRQARLGKGLSILVSLGYNLWWHPSEGFSKSAKSGRRKFCTESFLRFLCFLLFQLGWWQSLVTDGPDLGGDCVAWRVSVCGMWWRAV